MITFVEMKIQTLEMTIDEMQNQDTRYFDQYEEGSHNGYLEASKLELQTLKQILNKLNRLKDSNV